MNNHQCSCGCGSNCNCSSDCTCGCNKQHSLDYKPYMQMMNIPQQYVPMMNMPQKQLENMYPDIYYMIYPAIVCQCNMMGIQPGMMVMPDKAQLDNMVENIVANISPNANLEYGLEGNEARQPYGHGGLLRDLAAILLIRELLPRRQPYYGYPGYWY